MDDSDWALYTKMELRVVPFRKGMIPIMNHPYSEFQGGQRKFYLVKMVDFRISWQNPLFSPIIKILYPYKYIKTLLAHK